MGFAEKWAAVEATCFEASDLRDRMDRVDTIQSGGDSVHCVHIVRSIPNPTKGVGNPRTTPSEPVRPSREKCQAQGCAMWVSGGRDDRACAWRCIGSIIHDGVDPEAAHMPRLAELEACPFIEKAHNQVAEAPTEMKQ